MDNHSDPNYIRNFMNKSPVAAGNNALAVVCCDYWLLKNIAGEYLCVYIYIYLLVFTSMFFYN